MFFLKRSTTLLLVACTVFGGCSGTKSPPQDTAASSGGGGAVRPKMQLTRSLSMSPSHTCALRQAGLYCWGGNFNGQLGTGDSVDSEQPIRAAAAGDDIVELGVSTGRTCIRRSTGAVACWGSNDEGQIGDGTRTNSLTPVPVTGITDAQQIAVDGNSTCALRAQGTVSCWGGSPEATPEQGTLVPTPIQNLSGVVELRVGQLGRYCARGAEGWTRCWKLDNGAWTSAVDVLALAGASAISVPWDSEVCGVINTGVVCNDLANGVTVPLTASEGTVDLVASSLWTCGVSASLLWTCWNILPPMLETVGSPPIPLPANSPLIEVTLGGLYLCGMHEDRSVACADVEGSGSFDLVPVGPLPL
jgi:Regulator of chromosome condensation (RCC1) repeat